MARILPSGEWFGFGTRLWGLLRLRERAIFLAVLTLPATNRIAALASFWLTIRAIRYALQEELTARQELLVGSGVFLAFGTAAALFWAAGRCEMSLKAVILRLVREVIGSKLLRFRELPEAAREAEYRRFHERERQFVMKSTETLFNFVSICTNFILITALCAIILIVAPLVGIALVVGGSAALLALRARAPRKPLSPGARKQALEDLERAGRDLATGDAPAGECLERYTKSEFDRIHLAESLGKKARQGRILGFVGIGTALLMSGLFFLASEGNFSELDPFWLIVLVLAIRTCIGQGKMLLEKWGSLLTERSTLARFRGVVMETV